MLSGLRPSSMDCQSKLLGLTVPATWTKSGTVVYGATLGAGKSA